MKHVECTCEHCRKEYKKPILVTNFLFAPRKETYYACPYCLTKIVTVLEESSCTPFTNEETVEPLWNDIKKLEEKSMQPENWTTQISDESSMPQSFKIEKIRKLKKAKADLLAELEQLRKGATKRISILEKEVGALREEAELLKKLMKE